MASRTSPAADCTRIWPASCRQGVQIVIERGRWPVPPVFTWMQRLGEVEQAEMDQVFNMGIGLVMVVAPVLRRKHPPATQTPQSPQLDHRPRRIRPPRRGLGKNRTVGMLHGITADQNRLARSQRRRRFGRAKRVAREFLRIRIVHPISSFTLCRQCQPAPASRYRRRFAGRTYSFH